MEIPFKLLSSQETILNPVHDGDVGYDLVAARIIKDTARVLWFSTELAIDLPPNVMGAVFPRSSISTRALALANGVGVIDPGYRGEIQVRFNKLMKNSSQSDYYEVGDKIAQLIFIPVIKPKLIRVSEFQSLSTRGNEGFGSTDSKRS